MKLTFDSKYNIAYLQLQEIEKVQVKTIKVNEAMYVDIAPDGSIYGIEFLNPNEQLGDNFQIETNKEISITVKVAPHAFDPVSTDSEVEAEKEVAAPV